MITKFVNCLDFRKSTQAKEEKKRQKCTYNWFTWSPFCAALITMLCLQMGEPFCFLVSVEQTTDGLAGICVSEAGVTIGM